MNPDIIDIPGIGPAAAEALAEHRIKTVAGLARASVEKVSAVPGFSEARAAKVIAAATELLPIAPAANTSRERHCHSARHKDKKDKKGKKGKGKKERKAKTRARKRAKAKARGKK